jgi:hypothetical protein
MALCRRFYWRAGRRSLKTEDEKKRPMLANVRATCARRRRGGTLRQQRGARGPNPVCERLDDERALEIFGQARKGARWMPRQ